MLNLDKINPKINLNDFDVDQLISLLTEQKKIIHIVLIVITLLIVGIMFNNYRNEDQNTRALMSRVREKLEVVKTRDKAIKDLKDFKDAIPKQVDQFELMTQISNESNLDHVLIASIKPPESKDMGLYDTLTFDFTAVCDTFRGWMLFLRGLERSNPPLRIDVLSVSEGDDGKIVSEINVSAVHLHP